jgi:spore coat polysaccharide biosynthesis protein SpsF
MKYLAMIQARCGSTRLPNKVMMDLAGKPTLQRVIERVQRCSYLNEAIVVTSIEKQNLQILALCAKLGVRVTVGSENDVLDRFYQTAKLIKPEYVIRITADCPLFDPCFLDEAIMGVNPESDYLGQINNETYPDGDDIEIIKFTALKCAWEKANLASEREHVTQYIVKHPEIFRLQRIVCPLGDLSAERWTLDEDEDYRLIDNIYEHFAGLGKDFFATQEILDYLADNPELRNINKMYARNEGLVKSLANDKIIRED